MNFSSFLLARLALLISIHYRISKFEYVEVPFVNFEHNDSDLLIKALIIICVTNSSVL